MFFGAAFSAAPILLYSFYTFPALLFIYKTFLFERKDYCFFNLIF